MGGERKREGLKGNRHTTFYLERVREREKEVEKRINRLRDM